MFHPLFSLAVCFAKYLFLYVHYIRIFEFALHTLSPNVDLNSSLGDMSNPDLSYLLRKAQFTFPGKAIDEVEIETWTKWLVSLYCWPP